MPVPVVREKKPTLMVSTWKHGGPHSYLNEAETRWYQNGKRGGLTLIVPEWK